jgi:imidazolonepropionase-like amidohydrolase
MAGKQIIIRADLLYDGTNKIAGITIVVEDDQIVDVTTKKLRADISGIVTPAFIDAHSHIGMERQGEPDTESEVDEQSRSFAPLQNPVDSIYFDDRAFTEAVDFGVLYSCVVPGSGNILGGRAMVIKNFSPNRHRAVLCDHGFKMALGYNPRSNPEWKGIRPNTRMGNSALFEKKISEVIRLEEKARIKKERSLSALKKSSAAPGFSPAEKLQQTQWIEKEYEFSLSSEQWAVHDLLSGNKTIKVHVHKEDDALLLIDLKKKYGFKVTAEHACGISDPDIFNTLADNGIPVVYGPVVSFDYKVELKNASYKNVVSLMASRAQFGLMTDHPVTLAHHLRDSLKYFLIYGISPEAAIGLVTRENAKILGVGHLLGSIEPGKTASLIIWDKDVFHLGAFPKGVMAEGRMVRDNR